MATAERLFTKVQKSFQHEGFLKTLRKIVRYPLTALKRQHFVKNALLTESIEERFTWIHNKNYWGNRESVSGNGSTVEYTENLRKKLPDLISKYSIKKIFDSPCGDFNWMRVLLPELNVDYIGGDIVRSLTDTLNTKYKTPSISFIHTNLITDAFPPADLMICRDCLFHLSFEDTKSVLTNFVDSQIPYLLTTTHIKNTHNNFVNTDIKTGDFRCIDLFSHPYNFPRNPLESIDDWMAPEPERQMCLWSREQVADALKTQALK